MPIGTGAAIAISAGLAAGTQLYTANRSKQLREDAAGAQRAEADAARQRSQAAAATDAERRKRVMARRRNRTGQTLKAGTVSLPTIGERETIG